MKKFIFFIAAVWTIIILMLDAPAFEVIVNAIMFTICLYCFTGRHFREPKIYPKIIGVFYYLAILSSLIVSMEFESIIQSIGYNLVLTIEFIIVYRNIIKTYYESDKTRFGYVISTLVFAVLLIFITILGYDYSGNELALYFISCCSIFFFLVMSLGIGRYFIKKRALIKGYYSYWMIGLSAIICGLIDLFLLLKYLDEAINVIPFILLHVLFLGVCGIIYFISFIRNKNRLSKNITSKRIKYNFCPICKTPNKITDTECFSCRIDLNHIQPVCPNCGESINSIYDNRCSHCRFDLNNYFSKKINDRNYCLLDVVSEEDKTLHKLLVSEGMFVTNYTRVLEAKTHLWNVLDDINIYGKAFNSDSTKRRLQGFIHIYEKHGKFAWSILSPEVISNTHKDYQKKLQREKLAEERRKQEEEEARIAEEQERLRKIKEAAELVKRQEEERIKKEQEQKEAHRQYMKELSEQTGIILD